MNVFSRWFGKAKDDGPVRDVAMLAAPLAVPAVHVVKTDAPSLSHLGGSPGLPPDIAWPERHGKRLGFLARLSLPEIHAALPIDWLPRDGALLFFYDLENQPWGFDPKDRGSWAVLRVPDLPGPISSQSPDAPSGARLQHCRIALRRVDVLPSYERQSVKSLNLSDKEADRYGELSDDVFREQPKHQIGGYPAPVQGDDMELECQLASHGLYVGDASAYSTNSADALAPGAANWKLLLQMDSDDDLGVMWGDGGVIYYWAEADAARKGRFENSWLILQCF